MATPASYSLSLHDALPILGHPGAHRLPAPVTRPRPGRVRGIRAPGGAPLRGTGALLAVQQRTEQHGPAVGGHRARIRRAADEDRKSTRLNSSHLGISYAVF